ncbi:hypothetical protein HJO_10932 [Hyphomonas johnsonii MHS-2]|uniref:Uncharacterized protein n=2 Tax=Hyphomonas johnsonii TaxID=81031 RepID=A0A059FM79_9PROT|nr:hypothetical protein HJO_10932 [Hyphomonas johnsonii MHS-2]
MPQRHKNLSASPFDDLQVTKEEVGVDFGHQQKAIVSVWVLWRDASWQSNKVKINSPDKVREFFQSSRLQNSLRSEQVIGCVGLASNQMTDKWRNSTDSLREQEFGALSDRRSFELCQMLAEATQNLPSSPRFIGVGLGYNVHPSLTKADEAKQRALVFLAVRSTSGKPIEKAGVDEIIRKVINDRTMEDFHPGEYSRVAQRRPICWVSIERGKMSPSPSDC